MPISRQSQGSSHRIGIGIEGAAGGGTVSKEFETEINAKFEDCYATIENNKESIEQLK